MRTYRVSGPRGSIDIERDSPRRFIVRPAGMHPAFFLQAHPRLGIARLHAEQLVGLIPYFLRRVK